MSFDCLLSEPVSTYVSMKGRISAHSLSFACWGIPWLFNADSHVAHCWHWPESVVHI